MKAAGFLFVSMLNILSLLESIVSLCVKVDEWHLEPLQA